MLRNLANNVVSRLSAFTNRSNHSPQTFPAADGASWPHVVIVGGGFAGAAVARGLRGVRVRVTLIDKNVYKTFQPLLYQVATAGLNPGDVTMMLRTLSLHLPNLRYWQGNVVGIDHENNRVKLANGSTVAFDYLVLSQGATATFFGTEGAHENALPMYTIRDATKIKETIFQKLETASRAGAKSAEGSRKRLTISIVGGGPTGVEIAGALADFREQELDVLYPEIDPGTLEISLVQRSQELLKEFGKPVRKYAAKELRKRGVTLRLGHGVKQVHPREIELDNGDRIPSDITIWAAGVAVDKQVSTWGLPQDKHGRIQTNEHMRVLNHPRIFAAGDVAAAPTALPQLAQPAIQGGAHVAKVIAAEVALRSDLGAPETTEGNTVTSHPYSALAARAEAEVGPFEYKNLGTMATIGRRAAIAEIPGFPDLFGSIGWLAWIGVHVRAMLGHRNRRAVITNLVSLYVGRKGSHQPNPVPGDFHYER